MDPHDFTAPRWLQNRHLMTMTANLFRLEQSADFVAAQRLIL
jgi:hypothetical protein